MISWVIFYFEDINELRIYLRGMFGLNGVPIFNDQALYYLLNYGVIFLIAAYFSTPHIKKVIALSERTTRKFIMGITAFSYVFIFVACVAYLVDSTYNPFLYFRF